MKARKIIRGSIATILVAGAFSVLPLGAYPNGYQSACNGCHGLDSPPGVPTVSIVGLPDYLVANSTDAFQVRVQLGSGQTTSVFKAAGFWLWTNQGGDLTSSDSYVDISGLQATHNEPKPLSGSRADFNLTYRAPTSSGQTNNGRVTFNAWGNSVNLAGGSAGDSPNQASARTISICFDNDGDGVYSTASGSACPGPRDCNDTAGDGADESPNIEEFCDDEDNDCDDATDEGCDNDNDDFCDANMDKEAGIIVDVCPETPSNATEGDDCDDTKNSVNPDASETCDDEDDNCSGVKDEGCNVDGDDYCASGMTVSNPAPPICPAGGGDCVDTNANINPGQTEICNGIDDNCGGVDEGCDNDDDGYCDANMTTVGTPPTCLSGGGDCNDESGVTFPSADEICDGDDNDCNGTVDDDIQSLTCGLGQCQRAAEACENGEPQSCVPGTPRAENCSNTGTDDDCDGISTELTNNVYAGDPCVVAGASGICASGGYACSGSSLVCVGPSPSQETCANQGVDNDCDGNSAELENGIFAGNPCSVPGGQGRCATGTYRCQSGSLVCRPDFIPGEIDETCANTGVDDDCDGDATEIADGLHTGEACDTGLAGICEQGTSSCSGNQLICIEDVVPGSQLEVCDGVDNDCDGGVDNKFPQLSCGVGECFHLVAACADGSDNVCEPLEPQDELCDNLDNDCDGETDEGCDDDDDGYCDSTMGFSGSPATCPHGGGDCDDTWANTHPDAPERCDGRDNDCNDLDDDDVTIITCGVGECEREGTSCVDGVAQNCDPGDEQAEVCDGLDNDCDGSIDNQIPLASCGQGVCATQGSSCFAESCTPLDVAQQEVCDGLDNDCDGLADEVDELPVAVCGVGECQREGTTCDPATCVPGEPFVEICDGLDNNCNGVADDGLPNASCGVGQCAAVGSSCLPASCVPGLPEEEICDGLDNDCDGEIDDGCDDDNDGYCDASLTYISSPVCENGGGDCFDYLADAYPGALEICDGLDNDCNGSVDDDIAPGNVFCGRGACVAQGTDETTCEGGAATFCTPKDPAAETCDGLDNDCNGIIDDGLGEESCGLGQCRVSISACNNGAIVECEDLMPEPTTEVCDGLDNDCDGETDEFGPDTEAPLCETGVCLGGQCVELDDGQGGASGVIDYSGLDDDPEKWLDQLGGAGNSLPPAPKDDGSGDSDGDPGDGDGDGDSDDETPPDDKGGCSIQASPKPPVSSFPWFLIPVGVVLWARRRSENT